MTRRRKFRGVNLWNVGEAYVQTSVLTQNLFNTDPFSFILGRSTSGLGMSSGYHSNLDGVQQSLMELINNPGGVQRSYFMNKVKNVQGTWVPILWQTVATRAGFAVAKKLTRKMRSQVNSGFKMAGIRNEVMV
jgi:hypothetical protein